MLMKVAFTSKNLVQMIVKLLYEEMNKCFQEMTKLIYSYERIEAFVFSHVINSSLHFHVNIEGYLNEKKLKFSSIICHHEHSGSEI